MKIGLVQMCMGEERSENLRKTEELVRNASHHGAEIVCLPELFPHRYFAFEENERNCSKAESLPGEIGLFLSRLARETGLPIVGGSVYERAEDGRRYNTSLVYDSDGNEISRYRKTHIPYDPHYYERFYFEPGNLGYSSFEVQGIKMSTLICYDQWFPEPARILTLRGVKLIFYPTAIGWFDEFKIAEPSALDRWIGAMRSHASLNGIFTVAVNRVGIEETIEFWGNSFVADPFGNLVTRMGGEEGVRVVEIDPELVRDSQEGWGFIKNRRPDLYRDLIE